MFLIVVSPLLSSIIAISSLHQFLISVVLVLLVSLLAVVSVPHVVLSTVVSVPHVALLLIAVVLLLHAILLLTGVVLLLHVVSPFSSVVSLLHVNVILPSFAVVSLLHVVPHLDLSVVVRSGFLAHLHLHPLLPSTEALCYHGNTEYLVGNTKVGE